jgi:hypothetical protein
VCGTNQNAIREEASLLRDSRFDGIAQISWNHTGINDCDGYRFASIGQHKAAGVQGIVNPIRIGL